MTLTDIVEEAKSGVAAAEHALHDAQDKLAAAVAKAEDAAKHSSLWAEVEAAAEKYGQEAKAEFASLATRARELLGL